MRIRNINISLMLIAGIIVAIYSIVYNYSMIRIIYTMLIVMILFFVIGTIIQSRLNAIVEKNNLEKNKVINEQLDEEVKELENITPDPEHEKE
jgi:sensor domain CHASE-containing protein